MRKLIILVFILTFSISFSTPSHADGTLKISVETGNNYTHTRRFMLISKITLTPQMAFWLADGDGNHVADIAVTYRSAQDDWRGGFGDVDRPDALPVWSHARGVPAADGGMMPEDDTVLPDAVTMATPEASFTRKWAIDKSINPGTYVVMAEINTSYDFHGPWKEDLRENSYHYNGVNGQPSVVWRGIIDIGDDTDEAELEPCGHGSPTGANGAIVDDLDAVRDAIKIVDSITVSYIP